MKVVVFDDGGLLGAETALSVRDHGHEVDLISTAEGFDSLTREEIARSLRDCSVVIDLSHQLSLGAGITDDHGLVMDWEALAASWRLSTSALLQAETAAGVTHHVSLSVVGVDRVRSEGVFRALQAQEVMIQRSGIAYSIVRSTQMFESAEGMATAGTEDRVVWVPPVDVRPVSLTDVATLLAHTAVSRPLIGVREIAGPEQFRLDAFVRTALSAQAEYRRVFTDIQSPFFGARLGPKDLLPGADAVIARTSYREWSTSRPARESHERRGSGLPPDDACRPRHGSSDDGPSRG
ncbi:SDR family oxidoreductase [Streptomyces sp. NRRL WC-3744]|uniref:SDR family oxidoreductase n=1 Tax=Streptomyces sp. NRRL WC-3744 TaxID=1463935 RepID=UPI0007C590C8|nr:SDR family oxidoreductase [Streptomyces sp. NRRL WC-3744]